MEDLQTLKMKGQRSCKGVALILGDQRCFSFRKKSMCMVDVFFMPLFSFVFKTIFENIK